MVVQLLCEVLVLLLLVLLLKTLRETEIVLEVFFLLERVAETGVDTAVVTTQTKVRTVDISDAWLPWYYGIIKV